MIAEVKRTALEGRGFICDCWMKRWTPLQEARNAWIGQLSGPHAELRPTLQRLLQSKSGPETGEIVDVQGYVAALVREAALL